MERELYADLVGEMVSVLTTLIVASPRDNGEVIEVPLMIDGLLVDFDDEKILLQKPSGVGTVTVTRSHIITVETLAIEDEVMSDPSKPNKKEMN